MTVIHNLCFNPSQCLEVRGFIPHGCKQFGINLGTDEKNFALHFNPRFDIFGDNRKTILNSLKDDVWGAEVKESFFPFQEGSDTAVCFHFEKNRISIQLPTGNPLSFPVRFPVQQISYLAVGGIEVKSITLDGSIIQ
ncbi:galectin-1-like [Lithobates pipiens]